jgi:acyl-CoA synthetase (AMP-forming)/AMP-acid ligase II
LASVIYTSGSTGDPKGVMLTHRNMLTAATSVSSYLEMAEDDVVLNVLPLSFDYGLYQVIMTARLGATLVLERSFAFPARTVEVMVKERVTGFPGVPTVFAMLARMENLSDHDLSGVRYISNTAATLTESNIDFLKSTFPGARIYSMYGITECHRTSYLPPEDLDKKPGSVGIPIPNTEFWIVGENGERLGANQTGELVVRGATVMSGYWGDRNMTAEKLHPGTMPGEVELHTGDLARLDEDGYLYFVGRMDDIIKSRGEKVAPKEVEDVICRVPGIREAAVVGVPDEILGEVVRAFVVLESGAEATEKDVLRACRESLEAFMIPEAVIFLAGLPLSAHGKVAKSQLITQTSQVPRSE